MTNTIDTIKRMRELKSKYESLDATDPIRYFYQCSYIESNGETIEHLLGIIKHQHDALDSARSGGCFKHPQISDGIANALELSAPYAELVGE